MPIDFKSSPGIDIDKHPETEHDLPAKKYRVYYQKVFDVEIIASKIPTHKEVLRSEIDRMIKRIKNERADPDLGDLEFEHLWKSATQRQDEETIQEQLARLKREYDACSEQSDIYEIYLPDASNEFINPVIKFEDLPALTFFFNLCVIYAHRQMTASQIFKKINEIRNQKNQNILNY